MAIPYEKGFKVGFWEYIDGKFIWLTGNIIKVRKFKPNCNYHIRTSEGIIYHKWHQKLTIINH